MTRLRLPRVRTLTMFLVLMVGVISGGSQAQAETFEDWRKSFVDKAAAAGLEARFVQAQLADVTPNAQILELDRRQPEFYKSPGAYVRGAVTPERVVKGLNIKGQYPSLLRRIEQSYGVDAEVVLAIYGIETAYGAITGNTDVVRALATLAHDGRRRAWAEGELITVLRMMEAGDVQPGLRGSWAGAFGLTQFMPTSAARYGRDGNRDGRVDLFMVSDAWASTAHYLDEHDWQPHQPWLVEVRLPHGFALGQTDGRQQPLSHWVSQGVRRTDGKGWQPHHLTLNTEILLPTGRRGPAFVTFANFDVIKRYNNSTAYALAVGHLANRLSGGADLSRDWVDVKWPLETVKAVQQALKDQGHLDGAVDGKIGPQTQGAIRAFQAQNGLSPDGFLDEVTQQAIVKR